MRFLSMAAAEGIYHCCRVVTLDFHRVDFPELGSFDKALNGFDRLLGEMARDDFWMPAIRKLKRLRFDLCAAPFTARELAGSCQNALSWLGDHVRQSALAYPDMHEAALSLADRLETLCQCGKAPLLEKILELAGTERAEGNALLIKEPRLFSRVQNVLRSHSELHNWEVVGPENLRGEARYQRILAIGPPRWFPEHIFVSPRAPQVAIVTYKWVWSRWKPEPVFIAPLNRIGGMEELLEDLAGEDIAEHSDAELLLPSIDLDWVVERATRGIAATEGDEYLEARLYILADGWAVLLEADDSSTVLIVDLDEASTGRVKRIRVVDVERGMYLILRISGGGDLIVPVANRILGDAAAIARQYQRDWKFRLRERVRLYGIANVVNELREHGSMRANEANVRNWMSERNIRTQDLSDFQAIMRLVGLAEQTEEYWGIMGAIDSAHRRAGFHLRKLLMHEVGRIDLHDLERAGFTTVELPDRDAGSLGVFRVQEISESTATVPYRLIGEPFQVDQDGKDVPSQGLLWDKEPRGS